MTDEAVPLRQRLEVEGFTVGTWSEPSGERAITIPDAIRVFAEWLHSLAESHRILRADIDPNAFEARKVTGHTIDVIAALADHVDAVANRAADLEGEVQP